MSDSKFIPYAPPRITVELARQTLVNDLAIAAKRRSVRMFSTDPVPRDLLETAVAIAGTAPSGAHRQPWHFALVGDSEAKAEIRRRAEVEERTFYEERAPADWLEALRPLGTDFIKAHITDAPWLIVVFRQDYEPKPDGSRAKNYYMTESVGIAVGFLIQSLHRAGLATLTHTPAPMTFLREVCRRPSHEKPFVLIPVGYPAEGCQVPDLARKPLSEICSVI